MNALRNPSDRPGLLVDWSGRPVGEKSTQTIVGWAGPFGRERVVSCLPLDPGGAVLPPQVVVDWDGFYLADPDGNLIGEPALWVSRMLTAGVTQDTRRL